MIYILVTIIWFAVAIADYGELCYVWQLKEYRLDRFRDFIGTRQGRSFLRSFLILGRLMFLFLASVLFFSGAEDLLSSFFLLAVIFEAGRYLVQAIRRKLRRPALTKRAMLILFGAIFFEVIAWSAFHSAASVMAIFSVRFLILSLIVGATFLLTKFAKKFYTTKASRKIKSYRDLKIIGVTGSYGKTTVKNFLVQILSAKFKVIAAPKNINTEIGVARFILQTDFSGVDIFVVEMGAYKIGEIKTICDMVRPEVGILTAISEQHLSLFGSIRKIQQAKYELLRSLPKNGLAIANSDNEYCLEFLNELESEVQTFGQSAKFEPTCLIENLIANDDGGIMFDFTVAGKKYAAKSSVIGIHNAMNIAPCILVAKYFEMEMKIVIEQIENLILPEGTLQKFQYGQSVILDDSYNANPDGFSAALRVLDGYGETWKKIVITCGMLELGEKSGEKHEKIGQEIAEHAGELVIISGDSEAQLKKGIDGKIKVLSIFENEKLLDYLKEVKNMKAVILLENRMPAGVIEELKK